MALVLPLCPAAQWWKPPHEIQSVHRALDQHARQSSDDSEFLQRAIELVPYTANIDVRNELDETILCRAIWLAAHPSALPLVKAALAMGANPEAHCTIKRTSIEVTPLVHAVVLEMLPVIKLLVSHGAAINRRSPTQMDFIRDSSIRNSKLKRPDDPVVPTPTEVAYSFGYIEVGEYLEQHGGTVPERVKLDAIKQSIESKILARIEKQFPVHASHAEETNLQWQAYLQAVDAGIAYETNPYYVQYQRLLVQNAMPMQYDLSSGLAFKEWFLRAFSEAHVKTVEELEATGEWSWDLWEAFEAK